MANYLGQKTRKAKRCVSRVRSVWKSLGRESVGSKKVGPKIFVIFGHCFCSVISHSMPQQGKLKDWFLKLYLYGLSFYTFLVLDEDGLMHISQKQISKAFNAILPMWDSPGGWMHIAYLQTRGENSLDSVLHTICNIFVIKFVSSKLNLNFVKNSIFTFSNRGDPNSPRIENIEFCVFSIY